MHFIDEQYLKDNFFTFIPLIEFKKMFLVLELFKNFLLSHANFETNQMILRRLFK